METPDTGNSQSRRWAEAAIVGALAYVAIDVALRFADPWYSLLHNAESDYGVGPNAWLMDINFILRGAFSLAAVLAIAGTTSRQARSRAGLALIGAWAVCSAMLAFFPDNPVGTPSTPAGRIHLLLAGVAFLAVATGTVLVSVRLGADPAWRRVRISLLLTSLVAIAPGLVAIITIRMHHGDFGLYERIFLALEILWILIAAFAARRAGEWKTATIAAP
ncbi:MAG TPA: DUF998 domain-containing protein [Candidatus Acidoferrum sp.]|jgi:hypothetical membrane protein|nr:DUF998 domain-containing protein [Candidatus Acidoferrum sp.]